MKSIAFAGAICLLAVAGCGGGTGDTDDAGVDAQGGDSGGLVRDGGHDSGRVDAGATDAGPAPDVGMDAGSPDGGPADGGVVCTTGQMLCGTSCVDLQSNIAHCGDCATMCGSGEVCSAGSCQTACPTGQNACGGACFNFQTDRLDCGMCGHDCADGEVCSLGTCTLSCASTLTTCGATGATYCADTTSDRANCGSCAHACDPGFVCTGSSCVLSCTSSETACGSVCVETDTDRANCGMCGHACATGEVCASGACGLSCGGTTPTLCDTSCTDTDTDRANCGTCGHACADGEVCTGGTCGLSCGGTTPTLCGGACVNTDIDRANCGTCSHGCAAGEVCASGLCGLSCGGTTPTLCGTSCVNTDTSRGNCGTCGHACAAGEICTGGTCGLSCGGATPTLCGTACVDTTTDCFNCGTCGDACAAGEVCSGGSCGLSCGGSTPTPCGTGCVDTTTDLANCGMCGHSCGAGELCSMGVCAASCGGVTTQCNGGCVDTSTDPQNCGACNHLCATGSACLAGSCVALMRYPTSCFEIHLVNPTFGSGAYQIDPDGPGTGVAPFMAYCDMTNDGGGWTLLLKADGSRSTFGYDQPIWSDASTLNPTSTDATTSEAKFLSFSSLPFASLRIQTLTGSTTRSLVVDANANSLRAAVGDGAPHIATAAGRSAWVGLFPGGDLQPNCNQEGLANPYGQPFSRARIGLLGNQEGDCGSTDSVAGVGIAIGDGLGSGNGCYGTDPTISVGVIGGGGCAPSGPDVASFAWVYARRLPRACSEIHGWSDHLPDGMYTIDPDGAGGIAPFSAYCDMTNGGWTLVMATSSLGPANQTQATSVAPGSGRYLPTASVVAIASFGSQVQIRLAGDLAHNSITSTSSSLPIRNLRMGLILNDGSPLSSSTDDPSPLWSGPLATDSSHLWHTCGIAPWGTQIRTWPEVYWSCNNGNGLHIIQTNSLFSIGTGVNQPLEVYVR